MVIVGERTNSMKGIKRKIILNYCIVIIVTVFVLEVVFLLYTRNYHYGSVKNYLYNKGESVNQIYNTYMPNKTFDEKSRDIFKNIILSDEKASVQIISKNGEILLDCNGLKINKKVKTQDVKDAIASGDISFSESKKHKETIYSLSIPIKEYNQTMGVVRYSVSLRKIQETLVKIEIVCTMVAAAVLVFVLLISSVLAKSIVIPIKELQNAAEVMAGGNYKIRAKNSSEDEIGELASTFNYMAEEIEKSVKIKNDFISSISHELRTPLTSIQGWSETLLGGSDEEEKDLGLNIIQGETKRLIKIVEELLDFSRYQKNKMDFNMDKVDVEKLLKEVVNQYRVKAKEKQLDLHLKIQNKLKSVEGDSDRLKQVFINLLENSYKFTDIGGNIEVDAFMEGDSLYIIIEDNGIGIEEENLSKVFEKFFKENANKPGSGIGLSLCKEIIKAHNGEIFIESEKNQGTIITIKL